MNFLSFERLRQFFKGKTVAIVGSAPSVLDNEWGAVDNHDIVLRVNNYKLIGQGSGRRTDVHYSFYGYSIKKTAHDLKRDGVRLCMCKCPNSKPIESEWHEKNGMTLGIDFHWIYRGRAQWWFCDTYIPTNEQFLEGFRMLGNRVPTTGFSAILDVIRCEPKKIFITGFDFFSSRVHNVNEKWKEGRSDDPIGHRPELELAWIAENEYTYPFAFDRKLQSMVKAIQETAA